jgi:hypothetical protein
MLAPILTPFLAPSEKYRDMRFGLDSAQQSGLFDQTLCPTCVFIRHARYEDRRKGNDHCRTELYHLLMYLDPRENCVAVHSCISSAASRLPIAQDDPWSNTTNNLPKFISFLK